MTADIIDRILYSLYALRSQGLVLIIPKFKLYCLQSGFCKISPQNLWEGNNSLHCWCWEVANFLLEKRGGGRVGVTWAKGLISQ